MLRPRRLCPHTDSLNKKDYKKHTLKGPLITTSFSAFVTKCNNSLGCVKRSIQEHSGAFGSIREQK